MIVFPAIHLREGKVVHPGSDEDLARDADHREDPALQAMLFAQAGAGHLHVVDLDGTVGGESRNRDAVERIVEDFPGYVQLAGDVRSPEAVEAWFNLGVARVVIGGAALEDARFVRDVARAWEGGIVAAAGTRDGMVAVAGSDMPLHDFARRFEDAGVASLLVTDLGRNGQLTGCDIDATLDLARRTSLPLIASGGVRGLDDIHVLALHAREGIEGVICRRALHDGRLDLGAALAIAARA